MSKAEPQFLTPPIVLTIAGSDAGGGAGIQADLKTFTRFDCYGVTAITALTAQNTRAVQQVSLTREAMVQSQIAAVAEDMPLAACKTGMLASEAIIAAVARALSSNSLAPIVVDPVMVAKSGDALIDDAAVQALQREILPLAHVVTPNRYEVRRLLDRDMALETIDQAHAAGQQICHRFGCGACVVKTIPQGASVVDVLIAADESQPRIFTGPKRDEGATHGSGCAFSAAITAYLAHGHAVPEAVQQARDFIDRAIVAAPAVGHGARPVNPLASMPSQSK